MKRCKDCKRCDPYIERNAIEYDPAYGWCEIKKKDVGLIVWECLFWAPKILLITLALLLGGCVHVKLPDGTEFLMDGQKSKLPKVEITATSITIGTGD